MTTLPRLEVVGNSVTSRSGNDEIFKSFSLDERKEDDSKFENDLPRWVMALGDHPQIYQYQNPIYSNNWSLNTNTYLDDTVSQSTEYEEKKKASRKRRHVTILVILLILFLLFVVATLTAIGFLAALSESGTDLNSINADVSNNRTVNITTV